MIRTTVQVQLSAEQFEALWPLTAGRRIEKHRARYPLGSLVAEVEVFDEDLAPLRLVEAEFPSLDAAAAFAVSPWFGADVTADSRHKNKNLALAGLE